ncbi:hypothetical protein [Prevotella corporis]|uniref:hypothetical protein n=1 Tax=Prevotella corporis TaxID=28128 RepID=UPI0023F40733|nr:hypothetical protein [Prevotella corporis]
MIHEPRYHANTILKDIFFFVALYNIYPCQRAIIHPYVKDRQPITRLLVKNNRVGHEFNQCSERPSGNTVHAISSYLRNFFILCLWINVLLQCHISGIAAYS